MLRFYCSKAKLICKCRSWDLPKSCYRVESESLKFFVSWHFLQYPSEVCDHRRLRTFWEMVYSTEGLPQSQQSHHKRSPPISKGLWRCSGMAPTDSFLLLWPEHLSVFHKCFICAINWNQNSLLSTRPTLIPCQGPCFYTLLSVPPALLTGVELLTGIQSKRL